MDARTDKPRTRIQIRNRETILDAALEVFSQYGFRGATVDMIADGRRPVRSRTCSTTSPPRKTSTSRS